MTTLLKTKTGQYVVDGSQMDVIPGFLLTDYPNNRITVPLNDSVGPYTMTVSKEGPVVLTNLAAERTGTARVMLRIQDGSSPMGVPLMNAACHIDTVFGDNEKPFALPEGFFLQEGHALEVLDISDLSGESNIVALNAGFKRLRSPVPDPTGKLARENLLRRQYVSSPYFYTISGGSKVLTALQSADDDITIDSGHNFEIISIQFVSTGNFKINIFNQATGDSLICGPDGKSFELPHTLVCGTAKFPRKLNEPFMVGAGQNLTVSLTDTSNAENTIFVTLAGIVYRTGEER